VCLDASAIASWAEASLGSDEATRVEAHLAECSRCQAVLAAFAHAEPPAAPAAPTWKRWAVLLPIAAATGTLAIWIALPPRRTPTPPVATVAEAPHAAEPQSRAVPTQTSPPAAVAAKGATASRRSAARSAADVAGAAKPVAPLPQASPPPPAPQAPPASAQAAAKPAVVGESPLTDQRLASSTGISGGRATTEPIVVFESPAAFGGGAAGAPASATGGGRGGERPAALREALSLKSSVTRWRILTSHDLERSTDDGRTWERLAIDLPSSLTNGAAPSQLVCWIVGRAGVVLVTNDASHFVRLAFPATVDLAAVHATDALNATVTSADGRTFVTTDGGKTWVEKQLLTPRENDLRLTKTQTHGKP
jgi:hypothetical protein